MHPCWPAGAGTGGSGSLSLVRVGVTAHHAHILSSGPPLIQEGRAGHGALASMGVVPWPQPCLLNAVTASCLLHPHSCTPIPDPHPCPESESWWSQWWGAPWPGGSERCGQAGIGCLGPVGTWDTPTLWKGGLMAEESREAAWAQHPSWCPLTLTRIPCREGAGGPASPVQGFTAVTGREPAFRGRILARPPGHWSLPPHRNLAGET